jgi:hypothetical protein
MLFVLWADRIGYLHQAVWLGGAIGEGITDVKPSISP